MRRILVLGVIALLFAPFLLQAAGGIYFGYNVSNGVRNLVPTLTPSKRGAGRCGYCTCVGS